jgi:hypothetical protein
MQPFERPGAESVVARRQLGERRGGAKSPRWNWSWRLMRRIAAAVLGSAPPHRARRALAIARCRSTLAATLVVQNAPCW